MIVDLGYQPRKHQKYLHAWMRRFNVVVCHRRFGKTVWSVNNLINKAFHVEHRNPHMAYFAPYLSQAKRVAWDYLKDYTRKIPSAKPNEAELKVTIPRPQYDDKITIRMLGADKAESLPGLYLDGAALDEFGDIDPQVWRRIVRPMLSDRKGWAVITGTPKGDNHFKDIFQLAREYMLEGSQDWLAAMFKASETGIIDPDELEDQRRMMDPDEFEQEYECSFKAPVRGSYYGHIMKQLEEWGRVGEVPIEPHREVMTFWDLGYNDTNVIWFVQRVGEGWHVVDYYQNSNKGLPHYAKVLKEKAEKYDYKFGAHYLPFDAEQHDIGTGKTRVRSLIEAGLERIRVVPKHNPRDGIESVRVRLPICKFDRGRCQQGIDALKNYQKEYDEKNKCFKTNPKHDWASHPADAFRTFAMGINKTLRGELPRQCETEYDELRGG